MDSLLSFNCFLNTVAQVLVKMGSDPRRYSIMSKTFVDDGAGNVSGVNTVKVEWKKDESGRWNMSTVEGM